jgi:hypothetical protein
LGCDAQGTEATAFVKVSDVILNPERAVGNF